MRFLDQGKNMNIFRSIQIALIVLLLPFYFQIALSTTEQETAIQIAAGEIAFIQNGNIWLMNTQTNDLRQLTTRGGYSDPVWSREGKDIAFVHEYFDQASQRQAWEIGIYNIENQTERTIVQAQKTGFVLIGNFFRYSYPRWSNGDRDVYYIASDGRVQGDFVHKVSISNLIKDYNFTPFNARTIDVSQVINRIAFTEYFHYPSGNTLSMVDLTGQRKQVLVPLVEEVSISSPSFSSDGSQIAMVRKTPSYPAARIEILRLGNMSWISYPEIQNPGRFTWSRDDTFMAYQLMAYQLVDSVYLLDLTTRATTFFSSGSHPSWGPVPEPLVVDLYIESVAPVQVVELEHLPENQRFLVEGKTTAVKVVVRKEGDRIVNVPVRLVYGSKTIDRFYLADQVNSLGALLLDNSLIQLNFDGSETSKTIYFFGDTLTPAGIEYQVTATVDPLNKIQETNEENNSLASTRIQLVNRMWGSSEHPEFEVLFFRADWDGDYQDFTSSAIYSSSFLKNVLPVSNDRYDASILPNVNYNSSLFRNQPPFLSSRMSNVELQEWLLIMRLGMELAHPHADRFAAIVPEGWFYKYTEELTQTLGVHLPSVPGIVLAEGRIYPKANGIMITPHEIGHTYGLPAGLPDGCVDEYLDCNTGADLPGVGNYAAPGIFISSRIPVNIRENPDVFCMMAAPNLNALERPLEEWEFWIDAQDYATLLGVPTGTSSRLISSDPTTVVLASGKVTQNNEVALGDWYALDLAEADLIPTGPYSFNFWDGSGGLLDTISFGMSFEIGGIPVQETPFAFSLPVPEGTSRITINDPQDQVRAEKIISLHSPEVVVLSPNGGERADGSLTIEWHGSDPDGDPLVYAVLLSPDLGVTWEPLALGVDAKNFQQDITAFIPSSQYLVKIIATDGFNTGVGISDQPFSIFGRVYLPLSKR
jgi:hypothetical protein